MLTAIAAKIPTKLAEDATAAPDQEDTIPLPQTLVRIPAEEQVESLETQDPAKDD